MKNLYESYNESDTIAAEATPPGRGGISVIRISGKNAWKVTRKLFDRKLPEAGSIKFGKILKYPKLEYIIDEAVVTVYQTPHSYTGEDVIEISTHGSPVVVAETLESLYNAGARPAQPGEFTLRAFLNGRIDLTQAEAVADLIAAHSRKAAKNAVRQLRGGVGIVANLVSDKIAKLLINYEMELDFVEDDVELIPFEEKNNILNEIIIDLNKMLAGYRLSRCLREGIRVAIIGAPNVGKSSLFNVLAGEQKAIIHKNPGTTRDVLEASCTINSVEFKLFDTAGMREACEEIENEGIRRAKETAQNANITIVVSAVDIPEEKEKQYHDENGNWIHVLNKVDLLEKAQYSHILPISALKGDGIDVLKERLYQIGVGEETSTSSSISRERHYKAVKRTIDAISNARIAIKDGYPVEIITEELREGLASMDELTGKRRLDDILSEIFSQFCIGK